MNSKHKKNKRDLRKASDAKSERGKKSSSSHQMVQAGGRSSSVYNSVPFQSEIDLIDLDFGVRSSSLDQIPVEDSTDFATTVEIVDVEESCDEAERPTVEHVSLFYGSDVNYPRDFRCPLLECQVNEKGISSKWTRKKDNPFFKNLRE